MHGLIRIVCIATVLGVAGALYVASVESASAQSSQAGATKKSAKKNASRAARPAANRAAPSQSGDRSEFAPNASGMGDRHDARNTY